MQARLEFGVQCIAECVALVALSRRDAEDIPQQHALQLRLQHKLIHTCSFSVACMCICIYIHGHSVEATEKNLFFILVGLFST